MTLPLVPEASGPLLEMLTWWDQNISPVKVVHGYNFREISGNAKISNHGSGTAIDINPDDHPLEAVDPKTKQGLGVSDTGKKAVGTISAKLVPALTRKARELGLRWGGTYRGRKDEMHFEYMGPPPESAAMAGIESDYPFIRERIPFEARINSWYVPDNDWYRNPWLWVGAGVLTLIGVVVPIVLINARRRPS